jgi:hypothetical protein
MTSGRFLVLPNNASRHALKKASKDCLHTSITGSRIVVLVVFRVWTPRRRPNKNTCLETRRTSIMTTGSHDAQFIQRNCLQALPWFFLSFQLPLVRHQAAHRGQETRAAQRFCFRPCRVAAPPTRFRGAGRARAGLLSRQGEAGKAMARL